MNIKAKWIANSYRNRIGDLSMNERPMEYAFLFDMISEIDPETVIDIGSGPTRIPLDIALCNIDVTATDCSPQGWQNKYWPVVFDDITNSHIIRSYDFLSCVSVLEHISEYGLAVDHMIRIVKPGGYISISFPYNEKEYCPNAVELEESSYKGGGYTQIFSRKQLDEWFADKATIEKEILWQVFDGRLWRCGRWIKPVPATVDTLHHLICLLVRKR